MLFYHLHGVLNVNIFFEIDITSFGLLFRPHPEGSKYENPITYIPAEMTLLPKTKIGMSVGWQTKRGRGKVLK